MQDGSTIVFKRGRLLHLDVDGTRPRRLDDRADRAAGADRARATRPPTSPRCRGRRRLPLAPPTSRCARPSSSRSSTTASATTVTTTDATVGATARATCASTSARTTGCRSPKTAPLDRRRDDHAATRRARARSSTTAGAAVPDHHADDPSMLSGDDQGRHAGTTGLAQDHVRRRLRRRQADRQDQARPAPSCASRVAQVAEGRHQGSAATAARRRPRRSHVDARVAAQAHRPDAAAQRGWGADQFSCLVPMWNHESGWRVNAANPQRRLRHPAGAARLEDGLAPARTGRPTRRTQIKWGLDYIAGAVRHARARPGRSGRARAGTDRRRR